MNRPSSHSLMQIPQKVYSIFAVLLLVIAMYTGAVDLSKEEIIFPELAALAVGTWIMGNDRWLRQPLLICISPTLAAVTGIIIVHYLSQYQALAILLAFVAVAVELAIMRSSVTPSISAAILPIFLQIDSLYYPLAVGVLTGIIAVSKIRAGLGQQPPQWNKKPPAGNEDFLIWFGIFAGLIFIAIVAFSVNWKYILAPPLIVTFVEITRTGKGISGQRFKLLLLLGSSALWGELSMKVLHNMWHLSLPIIAACSVLGVLILFRAFNISFPPAMAISLLPTIIPDKELSFYFLQVFTGALLFIGLSWFYSGEKTASS